MIFTIAILKEVTNMNNSEIQTSTFIESRTAKINHFGDSDRVTLFISTFKEQYLSVTRSLGSRILRDSETKLPGPSKDENDDHKIPHPFMVILNKEISDHVRSWRFIILFAIIALTCIGSMYTGLTNIGKAIKPNDPQGAFFFLRLFTASDGTLPSYIVFIGFLGPLLGISMGFDAINSEHNNRTLSRILAQPIYRDYLLNAMFMAALVGVSGMVLCKGVRISHTPL